MTPEVTKKAEKLAELLYLINPNGWDLIPCGNDYSLMKRKAFLAGFEAGYEMGRSEAFEETAERSKKQALRVKPCKKPAYNETARWCEEKAKAARGEM